MKGDGSEPMPSPAVEEKGASSFFEEDEDETISLSGDELSNILEDTEDTSLTEIPTVDKVLFQDKVLGEKELSVESAFSLPGEEGPLESEEISLDEIPVEDISLTMEPGLGAEEISLPGMKAEENASSFFDEDEDESIGLTGNELDNILKNTDVVAEQVDEIMGVTPEEPLLPLGEADGFSPARGTPGLRGQEEMDPEQLKKILKYLDSLLDYLPEEKIKEFAKSEYFDLYHSLFNDLKI
jgi:hypothetical protein